MFYSLPAAGENICCKAAKCIVHQMTMSVCCGQVVYNTPFVETLLAEDWSKNLVALKTKQWAERQKKEKKLVTVSDTSYIIHSHNPYKNID